MNRTQRRAAQKQAPGASPAAELFQRASMHHQQGDLPGAAVLYKKVLAADPAHAPACDRLAALYLAQGKRDKAAAHYAELARMAPQTLNQFDIVLTTLKTLQPDFAAALDAIARGEAPAVVARVSDAIAADVYLRCVLENTAVRDWAFERWLTAVRASLLALDDDAKPSGDLVAFAAALARQCYINEYVFAVSDGEAERVATLTARVGAALETDAPVAPFALAVLAAYAPLQSLPGADKLLTRKWPSAVEAVVTQQLREPRAEAALRDTMPVLTPIAGGITAAVRQQYEEHPYPRWVRLPAPPPPMVLDDLIRFQFPSQPFRPVGKTDRLDILIAGCGTGRIALEVAQSFAGAQVLAVDISLSSLAAARRKTPPALKDAIAFAQADIMSIGSIGRDFDFIGVGGVLHHMEDALGGWRELIKLMRPNALMQVGLYSAHARREINEARKLIAERCFPATADGIRRARQDLFARSPHFNFMTLRDFFTTSEVRDLIFHVHERQFTIPEIADFIAASGLDFIGFEFSNQVVHQHHRAVFARNGWSLTDLARWNAYERDNPDIFASMYVFWVQKKGEVC
ncbi:class I SAM-dependent methyltransferase [Undibacter mobilis]|uniref:Methyltransferase domain-containing protein n=1 Tax=Undibacter mobilis TaxID=2292256 RepID=A0A371B127_9BRAD|nr:class I SAM-dependent methyltransferase [Undibacter mobilis]RDV01171.1 methyltransferase domain-containing protein [Undibacter mobilis]